MPEKTDDILVHLHNNYHCIHCRIELQDRLTYKYNQPARAAQVQKTVRHR